MYHLLAEVLLLANEIIIDAMDCSKKAAFQECEYCASEKNYTQRLSKKKHIGTGRLKKCNLTLPMSPTCQGNGALSFADHDLC